MNFGNIENRHRRHAVNDQIVEKGKEAVEAAKEAFDAFVESGKKIAEKAIEAVQSNMQS